jgi:hypothetical protein
MSRTVITKPTGKGERENGRRQLNASLPQQLIFDFNAIAKKEGHGKRDAIVEGLVRRFLEAVAPSSESLKEPPSNPFAEQIRAVSFSKREGSRLPDQVASREAIRLAREHALQIIEATSRKPPQRAVRRPLRKERAS